MTADETLVTLDLEEPDWVRLHVDALERRATGPNGETAMVRDNVIFFKRL